MARVVVGLSGGVDSSLAAALLVEQGHEVIGLFMRNWNDASVTLEAECPWIEDSNDALLVAEHLGIPFQVMDLSGPYKERIVDTMFAEYQAGRTPNPDVLCNREIKFDLFLDAALRLGADYVATGHYARREEAENGEIRLLAGADPNKDQSYFLCQLNQSQLQKALFPIGEILKPDVRRMAVERGIPTAAKKDSQGLCFIGKVRLPDFLQQQLAVNPGKIVEMSRNWEGFSNPVWGEKWPLHPHLGTEVGDHAGAHFFTVGQRKGLLVGGSPFRSLCWPQTPKPMWYTWAKARTTPACTVHRCALRPRTFTGFVPPNPCNRENRCTCWFGFGTANRCRPLASQPLKTATSASTLTRLKKP